LKWDEEKGKSDFYFQRRSNAMEYELRVFETVPAGLYPATVNEIAEEEGNWGRYLKLTFELDTGATVTGCCSAKFSTRSKFYRWVKALLFDGHPAPKGYRLNADRLVGRSCSVQVGLERDKDGENYNVVEAVYPNTTNNAQPTGAPVPMATAPVVSRPPEPPPAEPFIEPPPGF
jgi:hypothetical protein